MKWELTDFSITSVRPSIVDIHAAVNLWNDADSTLAPPVRTEKVTVPNVKSFVDGVTAETLASRWSEAMKKAVQAKVTSCTTEQSHINDVFDVWESEFKSIDKEIQG